jgi:hypothetical protein
MFGETDIMRKQLTTTEMGKYLVLRLVFSKVAPDKDVERNFRDYINGAVLDFSEKYVDVGLLNGPISVNPENHLYSLDRLFSKVKNSGHQIYLIVDECDSFVNRLLLSVDTSKPDLGLKEYEAVVSGKESMLMNWGNVIKSGTDGSTIARAFFTGVAPQAFSDALSSLNMVKDLTFDPKVSGLFGLTAADVSRGLSMIDGLTPDLHTKHLEQMHALYNGYRFMRTQKEPLFNTQYVLYYLKQLDRSGSPPKRLIDPAVSGSTENVAEFLIANYKSSAPFASLRNFAVGICTPNEMGTFKLEVEPSFNSKALFDEATVSASLISLAYFHGFLTYKFDEESDSILTSPNVIMQTVFIRALLPGMPEKWMKQMEATISSAKPDMTEFKRIAMLGVEEVVKAAGKVAGDKLALSLEKLIEK